MPCLWFSLLFEEWISFPVPLFADVIIKKDLICELYNMEK
jgi:hypothetical protein